MKRLWHGALLGILISLAVPVIVIASGVINFAATVKPSNTEAAFAKFAVGRSMAWRVSNQANPHQGDELAISAGFHHYADTCLPCHGAPGVPPKEFAKGLNPAAPKLSDSLNKLSDAQIFWIIKNGIRMTGMPALGPTHSDADIWKIVAFVRYLPGLTDEEKSELRSALGSGHQHDQPHETGEADPHDSHDHDSHEH